MRRVLFAFGFSFMAAQLCAASVPQAALLPAAFFIAVAGSVLYHFGHRGYGIVISIACCASLLLFCGQRQFLVQPIEKLGGGEYHLTAVVERVTSGYTPGYVRARLRVTEIGGQKSSFRVQCDLLPDSAAGDVVTGKFSLRHLPDDQWRKNNYAHKIYLSAELLDDFAWQQPDTGWTGQMARLRRSLSANIGRYLPGPYDAVATAMTIGQREHLTGEMRETFRRAGLSHMLVVSGLHLTLLCGMALEEFVFDGCWRRVRAAISLTLVLLMMAITGFTPSVCRAGISAIVYAVGLLLLLPSDALTSLGFSAFLLCSINCYAACDVGLQLSYCATLGVLFAGEAAKRAGGEKFEKTRLDKFKMSAATVLGAPFFAAVFTLPVQLWHGMPVSGMAVFANLLTMWMVKPLLLGGALTAVLGYLPHLGLLYRLSALCTGIFTKLLVSAAKLCAKASISRILLPRGYTLFVWCVLTILGGLLWYGGKMRWMWAAVPCFVLAATLCTRIHSADVVRLALVGNAYTPCVVMTQNGEAAVLYRGGSANTEAVRRYLDDKKIEEIDLLVDLRQNDKRPELTARQFVSAESAEEGTILTADFGSAEVSLLNQHRGNLAVLDISGYRAAMAAGKVQLAAPVSAELFIGGGTFPKGLCPEIVLYTSSRYQWLPQMQDARLLYSSGEPELQLRPGTSCRYFEVTDVTHTTGS